MFAPKSQYSHRDIASFGDRQRAIFEKYLSNLILKKFYDFNEIVIARFVLIRAFQRAIKRLNTISTTLISSLKRQLVKILWDRGSTNQASQVVWKLIDRCRCVEL
jgi:hypothetical protein